MAISTLDYNGHQFSAYLSIAEADRLLSVEPHLAPDWSRTAAGDKALYVIAATRRLDILQWIGAPAAPTQSTAWPRTGVGATAIPASIERATALIAGSLAADPALWSDTDIPRPEIMSERIGPRSARHYRRRATLLEAVVPDLISRRLIGPFLAGDALGIGPPV